MTEEQFRLDDAERRRAETTAALAVESTLTQTERVAITEYAGPRLKGARVADILTIACDHDANLGLTEPFTEAHGEALDAATGREEHAGYDGYLRAFCGAYATQAAAILTRKVPTRDHVITLAVDALKIATGEVEAAERANDDELVALTERRRTPHGFVGTGTQCTYCGLADGAAVHREPSPVADD